MGIRAGVKNPDGEDANGYAWKVHSGEHGPARPLSTVSAERTVDPVKALLKHQLKKRNVDPDEIGKLAVEYMEDTIQNSDEFFIPNAQETVDKKGHDHVWVDSGTVRENIVYEVGN